MMGGNFLNPGKYISHMGSPPNTANTPEPTPDAQAAFKQKFSPYALGRTFVIPTNSANVRSR